MLPFNYLTVFVCFSRIMYIILLILLDYYILILRRKNSGYFLFRESSVRTADGVCGRRTGMRTGMRTVDGVLCHATVHVGLCLEKDVVVC